MLAEAASRKLWGAMLTTDRLAPFNMPFYETLGFVEVAPEAAPFCLAGIICDEIDRGHDAARRVAMVVWFKDPAAPNPPHPRKPGQDCR